MRHTLLRLVVPITLSFGFYQSAEAQQSAGGSATASVRVSAVIPEILAYSISEGNIDFDLPTEVDFQRGYMIAPQQTSIVRSGNSPGLVTVHVSSSMMERADGSPSTKPVSDLEWSADGGASWHPLSNAPQTVTTNGASITYRMRLAAHEPPGLVRIEVAYRVLPQ